MLGHVVEELDCRANIVAADELVIAVEADEAADLS